MAHTRWNTEEVAALAKEMARLKRGDAKYDSPLDLARRAMSVLPTVRQRKLPHKQALSNALLERFEEEMKAPAVAAPASGAALEPVAAEVPAPPGLEALLRDFLVDVVALAAERLLENPAIRAMMQGVAPSDAKTAADPVRPNGRHNPNPAEGEERERLPKVLVCGLKGYQRPPLESKFGKRLRLKFWTDEGHAMLRDKAKNVDRIYVVMGASAHACTDSLRAANAMDRVVRVTGGASELEVQLEKVAGAPA